MAVILYDLAGAEEDRRFSPFCWRVKMALAHKGLEAETKPWRFTEKDELPQPNAGRVPVIVDDGRVVHDSSVIADYLEPHYADRPSLFGGETGRALTTFVQNGTAVQPAPVGFVVLDICRHVAGPDRDYSGQSREERFGRALEEVVKDREARLPAFRESLAPLRRTVERQQFLGRSCPRLCRIRPLRRFPMGARNQRIRAFSRRRSGGSLARAPARRVRRARAPDPRSGRLSRWPKRRRLLPAR